jgi:hypothetical protein
VWSTYVVLALPQMAVLVRCGQRKIAAITACAAASLVLPLLSLLLLQYIRWTGSTAPPVAALLALQPAGVVGLLVLSMLRHRVRNLDAPSRAPAGSASGQVSLFK